MNTSFLVPTLMAGSALFALCRGVDVFAALLQGAEEGLRILLKILPTLICLLSAVAMFQASGAMDLLSRLFEPLTSLLGIPKELTALMLIRPVSGGGALAVGSELMETFGPDSTTGRMAAVMLGSTETTFYTIAVYFGAAGIHKTRHTIPAALTADFTGFVASALAVRLLFP